MRLFVTTSSDDVDTYMSDHWARPLISMLRNEDAADVNEMHNPDRAEVDAQLGSARGSIFFGHGSESSVGSPTMLDGANIDQAAGVVIAVACRSALRLGEAAVRASADAYVGFNDDVPVLASPVIDRLIRDGFGPLMLECESPEEFSSRFTSLCQIIQDGYFATRRDDEAFLIGQSAQVLKLSVRTLRRGV